MKYGLNKYGVYAPIEDADEKRAEIERQINQVSEECLADKKRRLTPFERTRAAVFATGNKWAIENFIATHY